eukprot:2275345-Heterocapsa_arctica.AAC.1
MPMAGRWSRPANWPIGWQCYLPLGVADKEGSSCLMRPGKALWSAPPAKRQGTFARDRGMKKMSQRSGHLGSGGHTGPAWSLEMPERDLRFLTRGPDPSLRL